MTELDAQIFLDQYKTEIKKYFSERFRSKKQIIEWYDSGGFITEKQSMLRYIQTALLDEQICEVSIEGFTRTYICKVWEDEPKKEEHVGEDGVVTIVETEYKRGDYLKEMNKLLISPLECGLGNFHVLLCHNLALRLYINTKCIELGIHFKRRDFDRKVPCLEFSFPKLGIVTNSERVYRAKVPESFEIEVGIPIQKKRKAKPYLTRPHDISAEGMSLLLKKEHMEHLSVDDKRKIEITLPGREPVEIKGSICSLTKVRDKNIILYLCGVKFDLESRAMAKKVEDIVAQVQRFYLRDLAEKAYDLGIDL